MAIVHLRNVWLIPASIIIAMMLTIIPLPEWARFIRPDWVGLVVIFWSIILPRLFSIGTAWLTGLTLDILLVTPLGQNALGLVIMVYITSRMHQQFLTAPLIQQALFISVLLLIKQFLSFWINGMTGHFNHNLLLFFAPPLLALFIWPWLFVAMNKLCRRYYLI